MSDPFRFYHSFGAMTRFPPNVESIAIDDGPAVFWLVVRRNDRELRFALSDSDRRHLASLLLRTLPAVPDPLPEGLDDPAPAEPEKAA